MFGAHRHAYLLSALLLTLLVHPFLGERIAGIAMLEILLAVTLVASAVCAASGRLQLVIGLVLAGIAQFGLFLQQFGPEPALAAVRPLFAFGFFVYVTVLMLRRIFLGTSRVTVETICGALAAYLMLGLLWAFAYSVLEALEPGSFMFGNAGDEGPPLSRLIGFSFVTLTTLGYGNISPANPRADALAYTEAIVGQIYLTVLVARLVAMELTHRQRDTGSD